MKCLVCALAFTPLLIAASPAQPEAPRPPQREVIVQRVEAPAAPARHGRVVVDFDVDEESGWTEEHDVILEQAMEALREALSELPGNVDADLRFDWHDRHGAMVDGEHIRVVVERAHARAAEARAQAEHAREAGHLARLHGERARVIGLRAGARGMEAGLRGIDDALERGEVTRNGETRPMTPEERAELMETRARLEARIAEFRDEHAMFLGDDGDGETRVIVMRHAGGDSETMDWNERVERTERRRVRIEDNDGRLRVWLDGEELEGDALTSWLNSDEGQRMIRQRAEPPLAGGE